MLTDSDVALIADVRDMMTQHRLKTFDLIRSVEGVEDPFTGNKTSVEETFLVYGTWSPMTGSGSSGSDYDYVDGVQVMKGDIVANVHIAYDLTGVKYAERDGNRYVVQAIERLGLGADNRYFILLRRAI